MWLKDNATEVKWLANGCLVLQCCVCDQLHPDMGSNAWPKSTSFALQFHRTTSNASQSFCCPFFEMPSGFEMRHQALWRTHAPFCWRSHRQCVVPHECLFSAFLEWINPFSWHGFDNGWMSCCSKGTVHCTDDVTFLAVLVNFGTIDGIPIPASSESCMEPGQFSEAENDVPSRPKMHKLVMQWLHFQPLQKPACFSWLLALTMRIFSPLPTHPAFGEFSHNDDVTPMHCSTFSFDGMWILESLHANKTRKKIWLPKQSLDLQGDPVRPCWAIVQWCQLCVTKTMPFQGMRARWSFGACLLGQPRAQKTRTKVQTLPVVSRNKENLGLSQQQSLAHGWKNEDNSMGCAVAQLLQVLALHGLTFASVHGLTNWTYVSLR